MSDQFVYCGPKRIPLWKTMTIRKVAMIVVKNCVVILNGEAGANLTCSAPSRLRSLAEKTSHSALPKIRFDVGDSRTPASPRCTCQTQSQPIRHVFLGCGVIGPYDTELHVSSGQRRPLSQAHISHENVPSLMVAHFEGRHVIRTQPIPLTSNSQAQLVDYEHDSNLDICEYTSLELEALEHTAPL